MKYTGILVALFLLLGYAPVFGSEAEKTAKDGFRQVHQGMKKVTKSVHKKVKKDTRTIDKNAKKTWKKAGSDISKATKD